VGILRRYSNIAVTGDRSIDIQMNKTSYITPAVPYAVGVRSGTWMTYEASSIEIPLYFNVTVEKVNGTVISGYTTGDFGAGRFLLDISTGSTTDSSIYGLPLIIPANLAVGQFIPSLVPFNSTAYVQDVVYWHARKAIRATGYDHGSAFTFYWDQATGVLLEEQSGFGVIDTSGTLVRTNAFDDDLICRTELTKTASNGTVLEINLSYKSDGIPVEDAIVTVGTKQAENMGNGKYIAVLGEWEPNATLHVHIESALTLGGFLVTKDLDVSFPAGGNTDFTLALVIGIAAVIVIASAAFLKKHRKTKLSTRTIALLMEPVGNEAKPMVRRKAVLLISRCSNIPEGVLHISEIEAL